MLDDIDWWNTDKERRNVKRVSKSEHKNCRIIQWKNKAGDVEWLLLKWFIKSQSKSMLCSDTQ